MRTLLTHATLIDCVTPADIGHRLLIDDGRIREIGAAPAPPWVSDATTFDLAGAWLMPGLWDAHIHPDYLSLADVPLADQVTLFGQRLMAALTESGIVGLRCAGAHHYMDVAWKRAFDSGQYIGPRLFAAGHFLTTTGGHFLTSGHALECDGPYGFVQAIREQIKNGVDHIKLNLSGGIMGPAWDLHGRFVPPARGAEGRVRDLPPARIQGDGTRHQSRGREERHPPGRAQRRARLHPRRRVHRALPRARHLVRADALDQPPHAEQATNDWEQRWVKNRNLAHALCCRVDAASDVHAAGSRRRSQAGVKMALGSDIRPLKDAALLELGLWVRDGATPWQTLQAATRTAPRSAAWAASSARSRSASAPTSSSSPAIRSTTSRTCGACAWC